MVGLLHRATVGYYSVMTVGPDLEKVRQALEGLEYPAARKAMVRNAAAHGADDETLGHLGALPEVNYTSLEDVTEALHIRGHRRGFISDAD